MASIVTRRDFILVVGRSGLLFLGQCDNMTMAPLTRAELPDDHSILNLVSRWTNVASGEGLLPSRHVGSWHSAFEMSGGNGISVVGVVKEQPQKDEPQSNERGQNDP